MTPVAASVPVACPDCLRGDVMPSMPQGKIERFLFSAFLVYRFRCRACLKRFALRKSGPRYVPLLGISSHVIWGTSIAAIAVSVVLLTAVVVKARLAAAKARKENGPFAVQPVKAESHRSSRVEDPSPQKRANSQFMNNFQSAKPPQTSIPDTAVKK